MSAIAGITLPAKKELINSMLDRMAYRGPEGRLVRTVGDVTLGLDWPAAQPEAYRDLLEIGTASDAVSNSHYAQAQVIDGRLVLARDPLGTSPIYYGYTDQGSLCFASEVKGLLGNVIAVHELPPGTIYRDGRLLPYFRLQTSQPATGSHAEIADELRRRLEQSVENLAGRGTEFGAWLSGGLDSSIMSAMARSHIETLHTFAAGLEGAPDLEYARMVAVHIESQHHEMIASLEDLVAAIPEVIYHLESFDALLIRSSLMNYLTAKLASDYVPAIFSGEGSDELFAGYDYLKQLSTEALSNELVDITGRLHNTALQRVDRCAAAHGTVPYVGFLEQEVVEWALRIPVNFKIHDGVEKWILREAVSDLLPEPVVRRTKAKFWEGAGVEDLLARYADERISDADFAHQQILPDGSLLSSKEELFYYRIFDEHFGGLPAFDWIGRTKIMPETPAM